MSNIGNPIYVLCNYKLSGNTVIVTEIDLVLGSELSKKSISLSINFNYNLHILFYHLYLLFHMIYTYDLYMS